MSKRNFAYFAAFAVLMVVAVPLWAFETEGSQSSSPNRVADEDQHAKELFALNCGLCHTMERAGTHGVIAPDLDELLGTGTPEANEPRVLNAIENGIAGRMPAGILEDVQAEEVADFVARVAGQ
jgi:mono/diheme cytochrome c family protein